MENLIEWLNTGWIYFMALAGGVTLLWNSFKLIKEIKENISKPVRDLTAKIDKIDKDLTEKVDRIDGILDDHIKNFEIERVQQMRFKILEFSDSILTDVKHSKETYDDMLMIIDDYEEYCDCHPEFKNNRCKIAVENIKNTYKDKMKNSGFSI